MDYLSLSIEDIRAEYAEMEKFAKMSDSFVTFFDAYFKDRKEETIFLRYKASIMMLTRQIMALRLDLGEQVNYLKYDLIHFAQKEQITDILQAKADSPVQLQAQIAARLRTPRLKYLLKSFFIFNKMFYDLVAQVVILAYFENGPRIGMVWKEDGKWSEKHFLSSYNDLFSIEKPAEKKKTCALYLLDPTFFEKMDQLNLRYKNEIKTMREDFVHNFSDINFRFEPGKSLFQYQIVDFEKIVLKKTEDKGELTQFESIDKTFALTSEIITVIKNNFSAKVAPASKK